MKPKRSISTESTRTFSNIHAAQGKAVHALTCAYLTFNSCSRGELSTLAQVIPWPFSHYCYSICPVKPRFAVTLPLHYKVVYSISLHCRFLDLQPLDLGRSSPSRQNLLTVYITLGQPTPAYLPENISKHVEHAHSDSAS